jgi:hypothetical protein
VDDFDAPRLISLPQHIGNFVVHGDDRRDRRYEVSLVPPQEHAGWDRESRGRIRFQKELM